MGAVIGVGRVDADARLAAGAGAGPVTRDTGGLTDAGVSLPVGGRPGFDSCAGAALLEALVVTSMVIAFTGAPPSPDVMMRTDVLAWLVAPPLALAPSVLAGEAGTRSGVIPVAATSFLRGERRRGVASAFCARAASSIAAMLARGIRQLPLPLRRYAAGT